MKRKQCFKDYGVYRDRPVKIRLDKLTRRFYCPTCDTDIFDDAKQCSYCGQLLLPYSSQKKIS